MAPLQELVALGWPGWTLSNPDFQAARYRFGNFAAQVNGLMYEIRRLSGQESPDEYAGNKSKKPVPAAA